MKNLADVFSIIDEISSNPDSYNLTKNQVDAINSAKKIVAAIELASVVEKYQPNEK